MANVSITFTYPSGTQSYTWTVDDAHVADMEGALAAHQVHGYVVETKTVQVEEGQDDDGNPIMVDREVTTRRPATFEESLTSWSAMNVKDAILGAVNAYRVAKAEAAALAAVSVTPIEAT